MLRLVWSEGRPAELGLWGREGARPAPSFAADARPAAAKLDVDCEIELGAIVACSLIETLVRCGALRPEQGERALTALADNFDDIALSAPSSIRDERAFRDFAARLQASAVMMRQRVLELVLGQ